MATPKRGSYDYIIKTLIIGDSGVGKTCILLRYCDNKFSFNHVSTVGLDFKSKLVEVDGKRIQLQIWDTAGQDRFKTITQTYYKGAKGIILSYSCNDKSSFANVENWMRQINDHASEGVVKMLLANKSDAPDRCVTTEEGQKLADSYGITFFEGSAKEDINIKEAFEELTREIKDKITAEERNRSESTYEPAGQQLKGGGNGGKTAGGKGCC